MASGVIGEAILIVAAVIVAGMITGMIIMKVGTFEGTFTATTEAQKDKILSKFEILHVIKYNATSVDVWVKNTGLNPITGLDSMDVYFGQVNSAQLIVYNYASTPRWVFADSTTTSSTWDEKDTIQLRIRESSSLVASTSYFVQITSSNGVTDDYVFSMT